MSAAAHRRRIPWGSILAVGVVVVVVAVGRMLLAGPQPGPVTFDDTRSARVSAATLRHEGTSAATLVEARIDGNDVGWLILDSGAEVSVLDSRVAADLQLETVGNGRAGECRIPISVGRARRLEIGQAIVEGPVFAAIDLASTGLLADLDPPDGRPIVGLLGPPLFQEAVVRVDYRDEGDLVEVHDPAAFRLDRGEWRQLELRDGHAFLRARLEGDREAWMRLDTGKTGTVSFTSRYVESAGLQGDRPTTRVPNRRLCGTVDEREARIDWFELAGHRFQQALVHFRLEGSGGDEPVWREAGLVGQGFLRAFDVVFDYPRQRAAFRVASERSAARRP